MNHLVLQKLTNTMSTMLLGSRRKLKVPKKLTTQIICFFIFADTRTKPLNLLTDLHDSDSVIQCNY